MPISSSSGAFKCCVKLVEKDSETLEMLQKVYGDRAMKKSQTFLSHQRFREGWESVNGNDRSGRSSTLGSKSMSSFGQRLTIKY